MYACIYTKEPPLYSRIENSFTVVWVAISEVSQEVFALSTPSS